MGDRCTKGRGRVETERHRDTKRPLRDTQRRTETERLKIPESENIFVREQFLRKQEDTNGISFKQRQ